VLIEKLFPLGPHVSRLTGAALVIWGAGRYRNAMLPVDLLTLLREWWKVGHQQGVMHRDGWLFPGQHAMKPISTRQLHRIVVEAAQAAEITKRVGPHTLRHNSECWIIPSVCPDGAEILAFLGRRRAYVSA
jgi:site-specific recombinase XerD